VIFLKPAIRDIAKPLQVMTVRRKKSSNHRKTAALELAVGELTLVAFLISNADCVDQPAEATLVNRPGAGTLRGK
jgi:hypothetical protein